MNGVHDMGGMHGLGPVAPDPGEPLFHAPWEARALALTLAASAWGRWNLDESRHQRELIPGPDYLRMSYYEKWATSLAELIVRHGLVSEAELATGRPDPSAPRAVPPLKGADVPAMLAHGGPTLREIGSPAAFKVGDRVRARNLNPTGHTRLPRYVRGHVGEITRTHGAHVFPDAHAHGQGERPAQLYQVKFDARALWGEAAAARDAVFLDLWEPYLEPA